MSSGSPISASSPPGGGEKLGLLAKGALLSPAIIALQGLFALGLTMPVMAQAFPKEPNAVMLCELVASIGGLTFAIASPPIGRLIDRYGYRTILLWSTVLFALIGASPALLDNLYLILVTRALLGVAIAGAVCAGVVGVARMDAADQARMFGFQSLTGGVGAMIVFPLLGVLAKMNWRHVFDLHLVYLLIVPLILALPKGGATQAAAPAASAETAAAEPIPWFLVIFAGVLGMALVLPGVLLPFFMAGIGITDPRVQSLPILAAALTSMAASATYGSLEKRVGIVGAFSIGLPLMAAGFVIIGLSQSLVQIGIGLAVGSYGTGTVVPNIYAAVVRKAPTSPGRVVGVANAALYGTQVLLPFLATGVSSLAGPAAPFFAFAAAGAATAVFYWTQLRRPAAAPPSRQTSPG
jgi:MFS family permease